MLSSIRIVLTNGEFAEVFVVLFRFRNKNDFVLAGTRLVCISFRQVTCIKGAFKEDAHEITVALCAICFAAVVPIAEAQQQQTACTERTNEFVVACATATCSNAVVGHSPAGGFGLSFVNHPLNCCGAQIPNYVSAGGSCNITELIQRKREQLAEVTTHSRVLVANCAGEYSLFVEPKRTFDVTSLDRVLN
jgi:hypothetical protein